MDRVVVDTSEVQKICRAWNAHLANLSRKSGASEQSMDYASLQTHLRPLFDSKTYMDFDHNVEKAERSRYFKKAIEIGMGMEVYVDRMRAGMVELRKTRDALVRDHAAVWQAKREELKAAVEAEQTQWKRDTAKRRAAKAKEIAEESERKVYAERKWFRGVQAEKSKHDSAWMKAHMAREAEIAKLAETEVRARDEKIKDRQERFQAEIGLSRALYKYADLQERKARFDAGMNGPDEKLPTDAERAKITDEFEAAMKDARELGMAAVCDKIENDFVRQKQREEEKERFKIVDRDRNRELRVHLRNTVKAWTEMKDKQLEEWEKLRGNVASTDYLKRKLQKLVERPNHDAESVRILAQTVQTAQDFGVGSLPEIEKAQQILHSQQKEVDEREEKLRLK